MGELMILSNYGTDGSWLTIQQDVAKWNALYSLAVGGSVCIPSDNDRMSDIAGSIYRLKPNLAILTPTVAQLLDDDTLQSFRKLILGGEPATNEQMLRISRQTEVINAYGPSETSVIATTSKAFGPGSDSRNIGYGLGLATWVVDRNCSSKLSPVGGVGELWLEGPLVSEGYLNDSAKTDAAFAQDPSWLTTGHRNNRGRRGRLYKTGDLVKYSEIDGSLIFLGRKDEQVKVRGQRTELLEVQYHLRQCLPLLSDDMEIVAEVIIPLGSNIPILVAFMSVPQYRGQTTTQDEMRETLWEIISGVGDKLVERVPAHMVPSAFVPIVAVPKGGSGKTDRRRLREIGGAMSLDELTSIEPSPQKQRRAPSSAMEVELQNLFATVLGVETDTISADDSFLRLGDSIQAMRLAAVARASGLTLNVKDIFESPRLSDLAEKVERFAKEDNEEVIPALSLLSADLDLSEAREHAAALCGVHISQVEDVYPCTPLQEGLLAMTTKRAGDYVSRVTLELQNIDISRFRNAWDKVVANTPILRTRIIDLPGQGLMQAVIKTPIEWSIAHGLDDCLRGDSTIGLNRPLCHFGLVQNAESGRQWFVRNLHHALFDGWSISLVHEQVARAYLDTPSESIVPFKQFVKHTRSVQGEQEFWLHQLQGSETTAFPLLPHVAYQPRAVDKIQHTIDLQWPTNNVTPSNTIRAAWSILLAHWADTDDVSFGTTVTGRQLAMNGASRVIGPTIATLPVRVKLDWKTDVTEFLEQVQKQATATIPYEQTGLQYIRQLGEDAERACSFQTIIVVQPKQAIDNDADVNAIFGAHLTADDNLGTFSTYGVMLECQLQERGLDLRIHFDSTVIPSDHARRLALEFDKVLRQLCAPQSRRTHLEHIVIISEQELHRIWTWNSTVPETVHTRMHDLVSLTTQRQPEAQAVNAWDGSLTYSELDFLSTQLAYKLSGLGVGLGVVVPLCFEKSMWMPVAMLGVMKAGGASVAMDIKQPEARLQSIVGQVQTRIILSSRAQFELANHLSNCTVAVLDQSSFEGPRSSCADKGQLPTIPPSSPLYLVFTSGSTGKIDTNKRSEYTRS